MFRDWVLSTYGKLKQANPTLPILVREAENVKARIIARFGELLHILMMQPCTVCVNEHHLSEE